MRDVLFSATQNPGKLLEPFIDVVAARDSWVAVRGIVSGTGGRHVRRRGRRLWRRILRKRLALEHGPSRVDDFRRRVAAAVRTTVRRAQANLRIAAA